VERLRALLSRPPSSAPAAEPDVEPSPGAAPAPARAKVIVGLGNPGAEYEETRHNAGWWLLDALAEAWGVERFRVEGSQAVATVRVGDLQVRLVRPLTYMNRSGSVLLPLRRMAGLDLTRDLLVLVDDVALAPGRVRLRPGGSAGGHNGLKSIEQVLGTREYARLRIGVGAVPPGEGLVEWVLSPMPDDDREAVEARFDGLVDGVELWLRGEVAGAMDLCNR
jgi:peptidyl-tRNA hydrolase, PTH1 family